jgi:hypothetical protein
VVPAAFAGLVVAEARSTTSVSIICV